MNINISRIANKSIFLFNATYSLILKELINRNRQIFLNKYLYITERQNKLGCLKKKYAIVNKK